MKLFLKAGALTMFEITLANWGPQCWLTTNNVSELYSVFFVTYKCVLEFTVVQDILSVFIQQTFKMHAALDEKIMITEKKVQAESAVQNLKHLFEFINKDGNGSVSREECGEAMNDSVVKTWFSAMGVDVTDINELFNLID